MPEQGNGHCRADNRLAWHAYRPDLAERLDAVLGTAVDERPLQEFFEEHPFVLALGLYGGLHENSWVFGRPRLGGGLQVPDFLTCDRDSLGYQWKLVELESPGIRPMTTRGAVNAQCHHAIQQIRDYRRWLRDNLAFERGQGWNEITGECEGWVVIGRRYERSPEEDARLADFRAEGIHVHSYDRVLASYRQAQQFINEQIEERRRFLQEEGPFPND